MVNFDIIKVREQLESLKNLPNVKEVVALRKRLQKELTALEAETAPEIEVIEFPKVTRAQKISRTLKKRFRYLRLIRNQFPEIPIRELNKQLTRRQKGLDTDIPDVAWQNPSP